MLFTRQEDDGVENMTDGDPDTYWESDGSQGQHWIRLKMKKSTIVKYVPIDPLQYNIKMLIIIF